MRRKVKMFNRKDGDTSRLDNFPSSYNWNSISLGIDNGTSPVDDAYSDLLNVHYALDNVLVYKMITIRDCEPCFVTPEVKILLRTNFFIQVV
jgi:hypothetical protein